MRSSLLSLVLGLLAVGPRTSAGARVAVTTHKHSGHEISSRKANVSLIEQTTAGRARISPALGDDLLVFIGDFVPNMEGGQLAAIDWDMETAGELGETISLLVDSARRGELQPLVTSTIRMVQAMIVHTGCPPCGILIDMGMQILFHDDGAENTLWDQVSQQVRREIDDALLVSQFERVDKYMQAFKVQVNDSPFFLGRTNHDGPSLEAAYMWFQILDHDLAVNVGEFVPPAVHPSSGMAVSAKQRLPFLTVATVYMTTRLAILGKMRLLATELLGTARGGASTFLGNTASIERAIRQIDRKALTTRRDLVPPLAVLYYELMEPGVQSFNRRHDTTQFVRHTLASLAPENCLRRQRDLSGAQWRIPNLDQCIMPPLFREPEKGYPTTLELWSQITFPMDDPYEPEVTSTGAARCRGRYAVRSIVCKSGQGSAVGSCAGADAKIVCARVHDRSEQGGYGIITTSAQFGTAATHGRMFALCPSNYFVYGIDFETSFSLLCQSHQLVTMLDDTIFQREISSVTGDSGVCDLNMLKGVVVGMRCSEVGCSPSGEGAVVVLCKLLVTQKDGSAEAPGSRHQLTLDTTPMHVLKYSSVNLRSDHFPPVETLSAKIASFEGDVVDPGFCPLLPTNEVQDTSCRARLISPLTCNNGDDESLRATVGNDLNLGQHFVFHFYQRVAAATWNFTTDFASGERVVTYLNKIACKPNNNADGVAEPGCEQATPLCTGPVPAGDSALVCADNQLRAHVSLAPQDVGWHVLDVYTGLQCSTSWLSTSPCIQQLECTARWRLARPDLDGYEFLRKDMLYNGQEPITDTDDEDEL